VPIPFQDAADLEALGAAAFLKIEPAGPAGFRGALFLINARGEPLEFAYNRVETPSTFLWRRSDLRRHAERRLAASLLTVCARTPQLLLCLAAEVGSELFCQDLRLSLPIARIGYAMQAPAFAATEVEEAVEDDEGAGSADGAHPLHLFWFPEPPGAESTPRRLFQHLRTHGLLQEPFERAAVGLREVFDEGPL
jgi:hypothetical protein